MTVSRHKFMGQGEIMDCTLTDNCVIDAFQIFISMAW